MTNLLALWVKRNGQVMMLMRHLQVFQIAGAGDNKRTLIVICLQNLTATHLQLMMKTNRLISNEFVLNVSTEESYNMPIFTTTHYMF